MPISRAAIGVFEAAATTATMPTAAPCAGARPSQGANAPPVTAPMTNCGVAMPP